MDQDYSNEGVELMIIEEQLAKSSYPEASKLATD
jgi:hypothetical protein